MPTRRDRAIPLKSRSRLPHGPGHRSRHRTGREPLRGKWDERGRPPIDVPELRDGVPRRRRPAGSGRAPSMPRGFAYAAARSSASRSSQPRNRAARHRQARGPEPAIDSRGSRRNSCLSSVARWLIDRQTRQAWMLCAMLISASTMVLEVFDLIFCCWLDRIQCGLAAVRTCRQGGIRWSRESHAG